MVTLGEDCSQADKWGSPQKKKTNSTGLTQKSAVITLRKKADKPGVASVGVLQRKMGVTQGQTKLPPHYAY